VIREVSIDEAYLDVSGIGWDDPERSGDPPPADATPAIDGARTPRSFARAVKATIEREAGVPASVGVAPNMATAKVASDHDKPDGLVVVRPGEVAEFLAPLSVRELHGIGPVTARELRERGIETAGDLAAADPADLEDAFGARGREIHDHARGRDDRPVTPVGEPKSLSSEKAISTSDETDPRTLLRSLADEVAGRARREGAMYKTVGIKVVTPPFDVNTRARSLSGPIDEPALVERVALDLFEEFADADPRKLGVRVSNLDFSDADQASLDGFGGDGDGDGADGSATSADVDVAPDGDRDPRGQTRLGDF
jgi:DNA polymerase IV (DinB-like DNA polymerase)